MTSTNKRKRIETWFTKAECNDIVTYLCKYKEKRKTAIERIIRASLLKAKAKHDEVNLRSRTK